MRGFGKSFVWLLGLGLAVGCGETKPSSPAPGGSALTTAQKADSQKVTTATAPGASLSSEQSEALQSLKDLGAKVQLDKNGGVVGFDFQEKELKDDQLDLLTQFPQIKTLVLWGRESPTQEWTGSSCSQSLSHWSWRIAPTIDDAGVEKLQMLVNLKSINLRRTSITDKAVTFLKAMPKLSQLHLLFTRISDAGLAQLCDMHRLTLLDLRGCTYISDAGMESVGELTNLRVLKLRNFAVTNSGLEKLKGLKGLKVLSIEDSDSITDDGMPALAEMSGLE